MKKAFKILGYTIGGVLLLLLLTYGVYSIKWHMNTKSNMALLGDVAPTLEIQGSFFRDLNKNGKLDIYEDSRQNIENRVTNILNQMTVEEKAGLMFIDMAAMNNDGSLSESGVFSNLFSFALDFNSTAVAKKKMNHFNIIQSPSAKAIAQWNNNIQELAERTRLGIPVTIATDPRHVSTNNFGAAIFTPFYSKWCSPLGFAAIGDTLIMREFGNIARQEYKAVGIRLALSPMADLATEPRWGRINGTFGEDAALSAKLVKAYIEGFQGDTLNSSSVACMSKHFSGAGPQKDGEDAHFPYGAEQEYPGNNFEYHLIPFEKGAFAANTAQIMPYYGVPMGQTSEDVGFAYNKEIITGMLRNKYHFNGVVCTDWGLVTDKSILGKSMKPASAWGVENLTVKERVAKIIDAGNDMFGGESIPEIVIELVKSGQISEDRIDASVRRILRDKFTLGLFENPYVDLKNLDIIGNDAFNKKGREAQRKSLTLLKNNNKILPLEKNAKIYFDGVEKDFIKKYPNAVQKPEDADFIVLKLSTSFDPRDTYILESFFHQGRLDFPEEKINRILNLIKLKPTITIFSMERPPVIPEINEATTALIADFNCEPDIILDLIFGKFKPTGKLPFEIPLSMKAVQEQKEDVPYDSKTPLYPFGYGITYE